MIGYARTPTLNQLIQSSMAGMIGTAKLASDHAEPDGDEEKKDESKKNEEKKGSLGRRDHALKLASALDYVASEMVKAAAESQHPGTQAGAGVGPGALHVEASMGGPPIKADHGKATASQMPPAVAGETRDGNDTALKTDDHNPPGGNEVTPAKVGMARDRLDKLAAMAMPMPGAGMAGAASGLMGKLKGGASAAMGKVRGMFDGGASAMSKAYAAAPTAVHTQQAALGNLAAKEKDIAARQMAHTMDSGRNTTQSMFGPSSRGQASDFGLAPKGQSSANMFAQHAAQGANARAMAFRPDLQAAKLGSLVKANLAKLGHFKAANDTALHTMESGQAADPPAAGHPEGPKHLVGSNHAAINATKGQGYAQNKKDMKQWLDEPMMSAHHDSTLQDAFANTGKAGPKIAHESIKTAAAKALLAKFKEAV